MGKISPSKDEKAAFYAIYGWHADTFINSLTHINIAPQHASILAIALAKLIAASVLGRFCEGLVACGRWYPGRAVALHISHQKWRWSMLHAHRQLTFSRTLLA